MRAFNGAPPPGLPLSRDTSRGANSDNLCSPSSHSPESRPASSLGVQTPRRMRNGRRGKQQMASFSTDGGREGPARPPEQGLKCPRCDSPNTKFCYYNNYSLAQPRYFCKTCRRYWTKGGALRNVPIGGGCRKTKKSKSSSTIPSASSSGVHQEHSFFLHGLSSMPDFHLPSGLIRHSSGPGILNMTAADGVASNHFISYGDLSCSTAAAAVLPSEAAGAIAAPLIGFKGPMQTAAPHFTGMDLMLGSGGEAAATTQYKDGGLASSIESLSSINQGLHWKLQQQRLASLLGSEDVRHRHHGREITENTHALLEGPKRATDTCPAAPPLSSRDEDSPSITGGGAGGWFLESSGGFAALPAEDHRGEGRDAASNGWGGMQTWRGVQQHHLFSALP